MIVRRLVILFAAYLACCGVARAHQASESYLWLDTTAERISGQWETALRDLPPVERDVSVPSSRAEAALGLLQLEADGTPCRLSATGQSLGQRQAEATLTVRFVANCGESPQRLAIDFTRMFAHDPLHQGLLKLQREGQPRSAVFTAQSARQEFPLRQAGRWGQAWTGAKASVSAGVWHIWTGLDHLLFLLCLLLPLARTSQGARRVPRHVIGDVLKVITAFTLAHSVTLSLAALRVLALPTQLTESVIALSVLVAALLNLRRAALASRWPTAFAFGLVHGFGFASALDPLKLSGGALVSTLLGFNVGVELGQLVVVCVVLPVAFHLAARRGYEAWALRGGSVSIGLLAILWLIERGCEVQILPGF